MIEVVSAIIEREDGRVLIAQRPPGKKLAGSWEFPGGKLEVGESRVDALRRELREELRLDVEVGRELGSFPYAYDWGEILLHVFVVRALGEPSPTTDVQVFEWVEARAIDLETFAAADHRPLSIYLA